MAKRSQGLCLLALTVWAGFAPPQVRAQSQPQAPRQPVTVTQLLQRPEVRVIRVAIEGEGTERLGPWQPHFFKGGTTHAFTNSSAAVVQWLEVFVQKTATSADIDLGRALAAAMASLSQEAAHPEFVIRPPGTVVP